MPGVSPFYQLVLERIESNDQMMVEFEPDPSTPEADWHALAARVADVIHRALHVRLDVAPVKPGGLPRYDLKTKRIIDKRPKEFRRALDR